MAEEHPDELDPYVVRLMQLGIPALAGLGLLVGVQMHNHLGVSWARVILMVAGMAVGLVLGLLPAEAQNLTFGLLAAAVFGLVLGRWGLVILVIGTLPSLYLGVGLRQLWLWRLYWEGIINYRPFWKPFKFFS